MKRIFFTISLLIVIIAFSNTNSNAQTTTPKVYYTYSKPKWTVSFGPAWNLATNDAYGRANYAFQSEVLRDNYGMRWGWGAFLEGKYSPGQKRNDRIFLGVDYKGMTNSDFEGSSSANETSFDFVTIDAGYEYLFYGTYGFRSFYGAGFTGNFISGNYTPNPNDAADSLNYPRTFESSFRVGMEIKAGLEFVINSTKKNYGISVSGKYNLTNLFNDNNTVAASKNQPLSLNDGSEAPGPGFKRFIGIFSLNVGFTIYPDVKRTIRK